ncbi:matrix-remodeling-associated protein 7 [Sceloporus undulatus]|uniref:matrix-remodeling-associated protein 7 n=1 Tax=Sceloporus undulatus TaxID=8520 RepID=UPI001C4B1DDD|nr:matrix-remodeling-associated protein 7 [Sceloporus undulatus]
MAKKQLVASWASGDSPSPICLVLEGVQLSPTAPYSQQDPAEPQRVNVCGCLLPWCYAFWHLCANGKEEDQESENGKLVVKEPENEDAEEQFSFKYSPGKLRGSQYKAMMTKEEIEEEQRVKREQLTAIFTLLKEKPDTFGEMSETDIKEQLKLYDM